jgi:hypothetical protein
MSDELRMSLMDGIFSVVLLGAFICFLAWATRRPPRRRFGERRPFGSGRGADHDSDSN